MRFRAARCVAWCAALTLTMLAGCRAFDASVPATLTGVPWTGAPGDAEVLAARDRAERGDERGALARVEAVLELHPAHVDAHRLRQDLLRQRGRLGLLQVEAEQRVAASGDAGALYLAGRIASDAAAKLACFEAAVARDPELFWGWFGLAFTLRGSDPARALAIYRDLHARSGGHPLVAVGLAATLRQERRHEEALAVYAALAQDRRMPGVGDLGIAETLVLAERQDEAWQPLLAALAARPEDGGVRRLLQAFLDNGIRDAQLDELVATLFAAPDRLGRLAAGSGAPLVADILRRARRHSAARAVLDAAASRLPIEVRRELRRRMLDEGDHQGFLAALRADQPESVLADETNQVRGLWTRLWTGPWADVPAATVETTGLGLGFARALVAAGLLVEADLVLARLRSVPGTAAGEALDVDAARDLAAEVHAELAFEFELSRLVQRGFLDRERTLEALLDELREASRRILGTDVVGTPTTFEIPFVGRLIDPFGPGLPQHLARYNKHLVLGARAGSAPEGLLLTRLCVRDLDDGGPLALPGRTREIVGQDPAFPTLSAVLGGDLAGVALLNHYVVQLDAVRAWAADVRSRRRIVRGDGMALLDDPLPPTADPLDAVDVVWRLEALSPVQDSDLVEVVLDIIRWHERQHVVDSFRFLPPEENFWQVLGLLVGSGFSALEVESRMEGRAELAALAHGPEPRIVLAHIAGFVAGADGPSPHARGFARLARSLNEAFAADPELRRFARVSQWHRVPVERVTAIARELLRRDWP